MKYRSEQRPWGFTAFLLCPSKKQKVFWAQTDSGIQWYMMLKFGKMAGFKLTMF